MTLPVSQGFPDWQRNTPAANVVYLNTGSVTTGSTTYGPFLVSYTPYLGFHWFGGAGAANIVFNWWADQAMTLQITATNFDAQANTNIECSIPTLGPWVSIAVIPNGANATYSITNYAAMTAYTNMQFSDSNVLISHENVAVAAGATITYESTFIWPGDAFYQVNVSAGTFDCALSALTVAGVERRIIRVNQILGLNFAGFVCLPNMCMRITFHNTSAAGQTVFLFLIGGRPSGIGR